MLSRSSGYHLLEYAFYRKFHLTFLFIAQIVFINNTEFPFALKNTCTDKHHSQCLALWILRSLLKYKFLTKHPTWHQDGRVVKALDLRSNGRIVRVGSNPTPGNIFLFFFQQSLSFFYIYFFSFFPSFRSIFWKEILLMWDNNFR